MALGAAIAERFMAARFGEWMAHKTYAYISDGAVEEEISQGVGRIAGHLGMNNLIMYYDSNNVQLSTKVDEVDTENVAMKYEAWGWNVITIDGQDIRNFANTDQAVTGTVTLPNGRHSIKVEIMDGFGNRASVTRSFTVKGTANIPTVTLDTPSYALVGENYVVSVTSPNAGKIDSVNAQIVYGSVDLFDTDENGGKGAFNTCASLAYGSGFQGSSSAARRTTTEKTVTVNMTRTGSAGKDLFTLSLIHISEPTRH